MKTVLLRAPALSISGYGTHVRQVARWLFREAAGKHGLDITTELLGWGQTHWLVDAMAEDGLVGEILQASANVKPFYDVTIQVQLPNEWNPMLGAFNVGITAGVETDRCNPKWIDAINQMSLVVVPSEFTKQCFMNSGEITTEIVVIPEAFPDSLLTKAPSQPLFDLPTSFNFLVFGQFTGNNVDNDRKNLPYTIKWLNEVFADDKDVGIVIKTNLGNQTKLDKENTVSILNRLLTEIKATNTPRFYLLHGNMTEDELKSLYTHPKIKGLVSLTHGEGFGLPILEAAACDLPVVVTNWSGHTEFLTKGKYVGLSAAISPIHPSRVDNQIFMEGAKWAYPNEEETKKKLRKFRDSSEMPRRWAAEMGKTIREKYCFENIAKQYSNLLDKFLE